MNSTIEIYDDHIIKLCRYSCCINHKARFTEELSNTKKVQELGISPKLLGFKIINRELIFQKINGRSLEDIAIKLKRNRDLNANEFYDRYIIPCISLFEKLLTKIDTWDPNLGNILFDGTQFYLIDFDARCRMTKNRILSILRRDIESVCNSN